MSGWKTESKERKSRVHTNEAERSAPEYYGTREIAVGSRVDHPPSLNTNGSPIVNSTVKER